MKYIAFITKGITEICEKELLSLENLMVADVRDKFILFEYFGNSSDLYGLKTIDDVGIVIAEIGVKEMLEVNNKILDKVGSVYKYIQGFRELNNTFSITVSKYKNGDVIEEELKGNLSKVISKYLNLEYTPLEHTNFDIRFNITESKCLISVKLFSESLFRREYGHDTQFGSIRSTVASAILYVLTKGNSNLNIVDNFCGSGTFLCEGVSFGHNVFGGDVDPKAVELTKKNLNKVVDYPVQVVNQDATCTNWKDNTFDIAVSNYPWGKQVEVSKISKLFDSSIKEYTRILKSNAKVGFITTKPESIIKYLKKYCNLVSIKSYRIGYLGQTPTIVLAQVTKL